MKQFEPGQSEFAKNEAAKDFVARRIVQVMNSAVEADKVALRALVEHRVDCNEALAEHPSVQVMRRNDPGGTTPWHTVGLLGILSGIAGALPDGYGRIEAMFNVDCPRVSHCEVITGDVRLEGLVVGDPCPVCGSALVLGDLIEFKLSDADEHQSKETKCPDCDGGYYEGAVPLTRCKTCGGTGIKSKETT